jgi:hypothetical protein
MKVEVGGKKYCIDFKFSRAVLPCPDDITTCTITSFATRDGSPAAFLVGVAKRYSTDTFTKFYGRKAALTNALKPLSKGNRKQFWAGYLAQVKFPKAQARGRKAKPKVAVTA